MLFLIGNDLETSQVLYPILFCIIEKNTFVLQSYIIYFKYHIGSYILFIALLLVPLDVPHYFCLAQIHVSQGNRYALFAYTCV